LSNQIRGLLAEYGIVLPQHLSHLKKALPQLTEENEQRLSDFSQSGFSMRYAKNSTRWSVASPELRMS
jgi:transposase